MQPDHVYDPTETGWSADLFRRANAGEGILAWRGYGRPLRQLGGGFQEGKPRERTQQKARKISLGLGSEELGRILLTITLKRVHLHPHPCATENTDGRKRRRRARSNRD
jgi:hypothetical protein